MKSILYGLLLALVPDLAALQAGLIRISTCASTFYPLAFEVHARDGAILICALRRGSDRWQDPEMKLLIDVSGHVARPLEFHDRIETRVAGDRDHSIDVGVELGLCTRLIQWLASDRACGHRLDASADLSAEA